MSQQHNDLVASKERILQNAIIAIKRDPTLTQQRAAKLYNVFYKRVARTSELRTPPNLRVDWY